MKVIKIYENYSKGGPLILAMGQSDCTYQYLLSGGISSPVPSIRPGQAISSMPSSVSFTLRSL